MEIPFPTPPAPEPINPQPPPAPRIHRTERTIHLIWVKAATDAKKARAAAITASNKVQCELREAHHQQTATAEANTQEPAEASRPLAEQEIVQLVYMAAHRPDTPLSYADAIKSKYADEWREAMIEDINTLQYLHHFFDASVQLFVVIYGPLDAMGWLNRLKIHVISIFGNFSTCFNFWPDPNFFKSSG